MSNRKSSLNLSKTSPARSSEKKSIEQPKDKEAFSITIKPAQTIYDLDSILVTEEAKFGRNTGNDFVLATGEEKYMEDVSGSIASPARSPSLKSELDWN